MKIDIFVRTYKNDLEWLKYCLKSIQKFCTGFQNIIITIPELDFHLLKDFNLTKEKIFSVGNYANDYLGQQMSKMEAFKYSDADLIMYIDSDCVVLNPLHPDKLFKEGKPVILMTHYSKVGDALCWKAPTEKALELPVEYEFMRRHPSSYYRADIIEANNYLIEKKKMSVSDYVMSQKSFSEFNYLGAYMWNFKRNRYTFIDTDMPTMDTAKSNTNKLHLELMKQFWSYGGITPEIKTQIENILK